MTRDPAKLAEQRRRRNERQRARYAERKAQGICTTCVDEPAEEGRSQCRGCADYGVMLMRDWYDKKREQQRIERGVIKRYRCSRCGSTDHTKPRCETLFAVAELGGAA